MREGEEATEDTENTEGVAWDFGSKDVLLNVGKFKQYSMKQVMRLLSRRALLATMMLASVMFFASCSKDDDGAGISLTYSLSGSASGAQAVPATNSNATGTFTGNYDARTKVMTYTSTWTNLSGAPIAAGLYSGASGQVGTSISSWTVSGNGQGISGSVSGNATLNAQQEADLLAGKFYYVFNTTAFATGEIRGQITASGQ